MDGKRSRFVPDASALESRVVLSSASLAGASTHVAAQVAKLSSTKSILAIGGGTLGQPVTFTVSVQGAAAAGAPTGTVVLLDHGQPLTSLTLTPTTATNPRYAASAASATMTQAPGGPALWFGKHKITAEFVPSGSFAASNVSASFAVAQPRYTMVAGGTKVAIVAHGSGTPIAVGQTANILYTGYLSKNGKIFDDSAQHGGTPLAIQLGAGKVIPGIDAGILGMRAGESRIIQIPPSQGYGHATIGSIPPNSTLIFVVTLQSIS